MAAATSEPTLGPVTAGNLEGTSQPVGGGTKAPADHSAGLTLFKAAQLV